MSLKVTPEQLNSLSASVARTSADVRAAHQGLRVQLLPVVGSDWSGAAATQFGLLYQQFDLHAVGMSDALDGVGRLLAQAGVNYASVEQQIAASFR